MKLMYWVQLFAFVWLLAALGLFRNLISKMPNAFVLCDEKQLSTRNQPLWLCGQKIPIKQVTRATLALVDGLSERSTRAIIEYAQSRDEVVMDDLDMIPGIGPKTIERLREYFF